MAGKEKKTKTKNTKHFRSIKRLDGQEWTMNQRYKNDLGVIRNYARLGNSSLFLEENLEESNLSM